MVFLCNLKLPKNIQSKGRIIESNPDVEQVTVTLIVRLIIFSSTQCEDKMSIPIIPHIHFLLLYTHQALLSKYFLIIYNLSQSSGTR